MAALSSLTRSLLVKRLGNFINVTNRCNCGTLNRYVRYTSAFAKNDFLKVNLSSRSSIITRSYYEKQKEKGGPSTNALLAVFGGIFAAGAGLIWHYGSLEDGQEDLYRNVFPVLAYLYRFRDNLHTVRDSFAEPSRDVLLPDPLPEPYIQPKYTLVIELTDVLAHPEYDRTSGWRWQKRPGLVPFLKALTYPKFEIVLYTHEAGHSALPIIEAIDPQGDIMYHLFRDSTKYTDGVHVKDLSKLNRDLRKVILLDVDGRTSMLQPRNSLVLKKWEGDTGDISLVELIPFFMSLLSSNVDDVRDVLDYYRDEDDPVAAFRRRQDEYRKQVQEMQQQTAQQQQRRSMFRWR